MAPPIDRLFDHEVQVFRATVEKDNLGAENRTYSLVATVGAKLNRSAAPTANAGGGGLSNVGRIRMYMRPDVDVRVRDVLRVLEPSGVDHVTYEVDEPPVRPKLHHTQIDAIVWHGELPEVAS